MEIFLIILLLCGLIFKKASNQIEAGKINQEKSFDQIFGQRWDDVTEENICRIDEIIQGQNVDQNNQFGQNDLQINQTFDENMEVKEEESEKMSTDCDELEQLPINNEKICDKFSNAIDKNKRRYSYEEKLQILKRFDQIYGKLKIKINEKLDGNRKKYEKILAKHLGVTIRSIYEWKKQLKNGKLKNQKTNEHKREIIKKYFKTKNEFMQNGKHSKKKWKEFYVKIKQMIDVSHMTIEKWATNLGIEQNNPKKRKRFTIGEKMEMIKQYYIVKNKNPKLSDRKITKLLNIELRSLKRYKSEFKEKLELF